MGSPGVEGAPAREAASEPRAFVNDRRLIKAKCHIAAAANLSFGLRDFTDELLLPYSHRQPVPRLSSPGYAKLTAPGSKPRFSYRSDEGEHQETESL